MTTLTKTTCLLLERGLEDYKLFDEINKAMAALGHLSPKDIAKNYPHLLALRRCLQDESEGEF